MQIKHLAQARKAGEAMHEPRRRGRPLGSSTRVLRPDRVLGVHHFAFLRAGLQGLDLRAAWHRYLGATERMGDLRQVVRTHRAWLDEVLDRAIRLAATLPAAHPLHESVALLRHHLNAARAPSQAQTTMQVHPLPSLEEFIAQSGLDPDMYSEAELLLEYRLQYRLDKLAGGAAVAMSAMRLHDDTGAAPGKHTPRAVMRALHLVESLLVWQPQTNDPVDRWFAGPTLKRLRSAGLLNLEQLAAWVLARQHRWAEGVPGLGSVRAAAIEDWLAQQHQVWQRSWPTEGWTGPERARRRWLGVVQPGPGQSGPLERWRPPEGLSGGREWAVRAGLGLSNTLGATDDASAIGAWLAGFNGQPDTARAYRKEVERFWQWCVLVQDTTLAGLTPSRLTDYQVFLRAPPADWVQATALPRTDPAWRPFRCALSARSQAYALRIVQRLMFDLADAGYLARGWKLPASTGESCAALTAAPGPDTEGERPAAASAPGTERQVAAPERHGVEDEHGQGSLMVSGQRLPGAITIAGSAARQTPATKQASAAARRRMQLVHHVMQRYGWPARDLALARFEPATDRTVTPPAWALLADGRRVALTAETLAMVRAHHADLSGLAPAPCPAPLVLALRAGVSRWCASGDDVALVPPQALVQQRALGWPGLRRALVRWGWGIPDIDRMLGPEPDWSSSSDEAPATTRSI